MAFVPEGQHDSSQARSAWNHEENSPVPSGTIEQISAACGHGTRTGTVCAAARHRVGKSKRGSSTVARILDPDSPIPEALPRFSAPTAARQLKILASSTRSKSNSNRVRFSRYVTVYGDDTKDRELYAARPLRTKAFTQRFQNTSSGDKNAMGIPAQ